MAREMSRAPPFHLPVNFKATGYAVFQQLDAPLQWLWTVLNKMGHLEVWTEQNLPLDSKCFNKWEVLCFQLDSNLSLKQLIILVCTHFNYAVNTVCMTCYKTIRKYLFHLSMTFRLKQGKKVIDNVQIKKNDMKTVWCVLVYPWTLMPLHFESQEIQF